MRKSYQSWYKTRLGRVRRYWIVVSGDIFRSAGLLAVVLCFVFLMVYGYAGLLTSSIFAIRSIEIKGLNELTEKDVYDLARLRTSQNILTVNLARTIRRIQVNPWVREVSISRILPDRLKIEILERRALAMLKNADAFFLLDQSGFAFKELTQTDVVDLPVINGWTGSPQGTSGLSLEKTVNLIEAYTGEKELTSLGSLSEVHLNEVFGITIFTNRGISLYLGFDDYEVKLVRLKQVWQDLERRGPVQGFLRIDLSNPDKATVDWREVQPPKLQIKSRQGLRT
ncbi:MAG: FtsQ-type POTRA domain-containing protein [Smithellaceae bacterium]|nr:FtsQ-type POTRA domain-containing protein [Smithellaceae bacterium]